MYGILFGVVALLLSVWGFVKWWFIFMDIFKGVVPLLLLIFGIAAIVSGLKKMQGSNALFKNSQKDKDSDNVTESDDDAEIKVEPSTNAKRKKAT